MVAETFDALGFAKKLENVGVPREQAEAQAEAMRSAFAAYDAGRMKELATRGDLREMELQLENRIENSKQEMLKWVIGITITQTALIIAVIGIAVAILLR